MRQVRSSILQRTVLDVEFHAKFVAMERTLGMLGGSDAELERLSELRHAALGFAPSSAGNLMQGAAGSRVITVPHEAAGAPAIMTSAQYEMFNELEGSDRILVPVPAFLACARL